MKISVLSLAALPAMAAAYEIGCIYPAAMPDPMEARFYLHQFGGSYLMSKKTETPIVIHIAAIGNTCQTLCLAVHDEKVLDPLTMERPLFSAPKEYHNSWSRMLCMAQCYSIIAYEAGMGNFYQPLWDKWQLEGIVPRRNEIGLGWLAAVEGTTQPLQDLLEKEDFHPLTMGHMVATELLLYVIDDGWNAMGNYTYDTETGEPVLCTGNCERYKDTYGYFPSNNFMGKRENDTTKYIVEGTDMRWQPMVENDGNGYFSAQQHVTPHIGFHAKTKLYDSVDDFPEAPPPDYDYYEESQLVVERLKETASDSIKKQKISFYDKKMMVIATVESFVKHNWADKYSFEDEILFIDGLSNGEYEATLMAWREKVRYDLVRPHTVIRRWGSDILETFGGDKTVDGPVEIAARDFHAFQRVMPHSEYISGSSCICTAYGEFTDAFTLEYFNDTAINVPFGGASEAMPGGKGFGCDPTLDPPLFVSVACNDSFIIDDMKTLIHECGQSRLWGGIHYTAAVVEGEKMCKGVGDMAAEKEKKIRNGSTFGSQFFAGDPRPTCSIPNVNEATEVGRNGDQTAPLEASAASEPFVAFVTLLLASAMGILAF